MPTLNINNDVVVFPSANVGIGTTSPSNKLHVVGSASGDAANIRIDSTNEYGGLYVTENGTFRTFLGYGNAGTIFSNAQTDSTALRGANYLHLGASSAATITINGSNDCVGIGTTAPDAKLVIVTGSADDSGNSFSFTGYGSKEYVSISKLGFIRSRASDLNGANMHFLDNGGTNRMEMAVNAT